MTSRAERRRKTREERKTKAPPPEAYRGISEEELRDAEAELRATAPILESDVATRWAALLDKWARFNSQRELAKTDYDLRAELPAGTAKSSVESYAQAKRALLGIETEMVRMLSDEAEDDSERDGMLHGRFAFHTVSLTRTVWVSDVLRQRLVQQLEKTLKPTEDEKGVAEAA